MNREWMENFKEEPLLKWLWCSIGFFAVVIMVVSYLGGHHNYISFSTGVILAAIAAIPVVGVTLIMYIIADRETRKAYSIRITLAILFIALKYAWKYVS